jgi:pyruvate dehydrogenase E2 component (dihydrolipoamide acetyltransferase)
MAIDVRMPKLSDNMEEGVIIRWMKSPGDQVTKGEPLAEVETDKADVELEAAESGVLREIKVAEGQSAAVGATIAVLGESDGKTKASAGPDQSDEAAEAASAQADRPPERGAGASATRSRAAPGRQEARAEKAEAEPEEEQEEEAAEEPSRPPRAATTATRSEQRVRASPLAWRLADEAGVNLAGVRGSGPGGRIVKRDVEASARDRAGAAPQRAPGEATAEPRDRTVRARVSAEEAPAGAKAAEEARASGPRLVEATRMRLAIAKRMTEAKRDIPHFYVTAEIDMTEAMHLRESIKRREAMPGLTVTHLLLRTLAIALMRHPRVNASWRERAIELHDEVNIGIAVAVEDGLVVPVLHRANTLTLGEIAAQASALTDKARSGKFGGEDLTGGTFSLSNVGMLDVEELAAVINPPQAAILAVGAVKDRPIVRDGQLAVAKTMRATLSCDHRVLNGVEGGRFLEELKGILENPVTLLLE